MRMKKYFHSKFRFLSSLLFSQAIGTGQEEYPSKGQLQRSKRFIMLCSLVLSFVIFMALNLDVNEFDL